MRRRLLLLVLALAPFQTSASSVFGKRASSQKRAPELLIPEDPTVLAASAPTPVSSARNNTDSTNPNNSNNAVKRNEQRTVTKAARKGTETPRTPPKAQPPSPPKSQPGGSLFSRATAEADDGQQSRRRKSGSDRNNNNDTGDNDENENEYFEDAAISPVPEIPSWAPYYSEDENDASTTNANSGTILTTTPRVLLRRDEQDILGFIPRVGNLNIQIEARSNNHFSQRYFRRQRRQRDAFSPKSWLDAATSSTPIPNDRSLNVHVDPASMVRLSQGLLILSQAFSAALLATLRLLAPMILARRCIKAVMDFVQDWYRGRYLRTAYERFEDQYLKYYQMPAVFRSACRFFAELTILFIMGRIVQWMIGLHEAPCFVVKRGGCQWWCALLWMVAVFGTGHGLSTALAIWGGPLRIQVAHVATTISSRPSARSIFTRPWCILKWMRDPDEWLRMIAFEPRQRQLLRDATYNLKPFHPDPLMYPSTWRVFKVLQVLAIAKEMSEGMGLMKTMMRRYLIQQAMGDEWYRVLMCEKRSGLGIALAVGHTLASFAVFWTAAMKPAAYSSSISKLFLIPSLVAAIVSTWMNVVVYFARREANREYEIVTAEEALKKKHKDGVKSIIWRSLLPATTSIATAEQDKSDNGR